MTHEKSITRVVGGVLPQPLVDYLNMYTFACDRTKSDLFHDAFKKWYEIRKEVLSINVLKSNIQAKLQEKWMIHSLELFDKNPAKLHTEFITFKDKNKKILLEKLPDHIVEEIINDLEL